MSKRVTVKGETIQWIRRGVIIGKKRKKGEVRRKEEKGRTGRYHVGTKEEGKEAEESDEEGEVKVGERSGERE